MKTALLLLPAALTSLAATVTLPNTRADLLRGEAVSGSLRVMPWTERRGRPRACPRKPKLTHAPDDAALLKMLEEGIRGTEMPRRGALSDREKRQTAAYVRSLGRLRQAGRPATAAHGAEIYHGKGNCAGCHSIHGEGGVAGPDLPPSAMRAAPLIFANRS